ncbi:MAG: hypothetical protein ACREOA_01365 [Candidatus Dormibacteria bacterium]
MIWIFLVSVLAAHEASHALALWAYRVRFQPRIWYSRAFPWLGFGWKYYIDGLDPAKRRTILVVGPIVEAILWCLGALIFHQYFLPMMVMAGLTLWLNRLVPGGDLWKAQRLTQEARRAGPQAATFPVPAQNPQS